ncbi:carbohydrate sulfotransferase 9-like [Ylistrum balloti]|uniref:carbohydrate sulfotransferase 9-like n=1 Tax=Ylistrum balloti TaxID=509963 RepID=UPI002905BC02|nr:carbohydrate sulfotransferase 9-like [Ylistrum balloti]
MTFILAKLRNISRNRHHRKIVILICMVGTVLMVAKYHRSAAVRNVPKDTMQLVEHLVNFATKNTSQGAAQEVNSEPGPVNCTCKCPEVVTVPAPMEPVVTGKPYRNPVQIGRRATMLKECKKLGNNYNGTLPDSKIKANMIYDEKSNLVFCDIPKAGSTFLKQVLHIVAGHRHKKDPFSIEGSDVHRIPFTTFSKIPYDQALKRLVHSIKFLFVRDPYSRMLSGYVDKLYTNNYIFWGKTGKGIVENHRINASRLSKECGHDITFSEFIQHVIKSETSGNHRDPHWYPMFDACRPCSLEYDVIGKMESFKEDLENFLKSQNLQNIVDISNMNQGNDNVAVTVTVNRAFEAVRERPKCIPLQHALVRAWKVLQIRGVLSPLSNFPYELIKNSPNITQPKFQDIVVKEMKQTPMNQSQKAISRQQAMIHAYRSVSSEILKNFTTVFHPDFAVFGYDKNLGKKDEKFLTWDPFKLNF